jgi:hypothetical protein
MLDPRVKTPQDLLDSPQIFTAFLLTALIIHERFKFDQTAEENLKTCKALLTKYFYHWTFPTFLPFSACLDEVDLLALPRGGMEMKRSMRLWVKSCGGLVTRESGRLKSMGFDRLSKLDEASEEEKAADLEALGRVTVYCFAGGLDKGELQLK